jgi:hypothetical protein
MTGKAFSYIRLIGRGNSSADNRNFIAEFRLFGYISENSTLKKPTILIYPNPTPGILTIEPLSLIEEESYFINVLNTSGQIIHNQKINSSIGKFDIDISSLRPGSYYLQIISEKIVEFIKITKN